MVWRAIVRAIAAVSGNDLTRTVLVGLFQISVQVSLRFVVTNELKFTRTQISSFIVGE